MGFQQDNQRIGVVGLLLIIAQADQEVLSLDHQQEGVNLIHFKKSRHRMLVVQ